MAERASPFASAVHEHRAGVRLSALPRGSIWQVACWPESFEDVAAALVQTLGCEAPEPGRGISTSDARLLIRVEPLKWWVLGPDGAECPLRPGAVQGAWLDLGHDQAGIAVEGERAAELMQRLVSLDLRERSFPDLSCAATIAHHMITRVLRRDMDGVPRYEVLVMRSFADELHGLLAHHLALFA